MLKRWPAFTRFLDDGRICLSNNGAERALRGIALGRKSWLFAGSDRGGQRAAAMYSLIVTAKLNDVDPQAWLADILAGPPNIRPTGSTNSCRGTGGRIRHLAFRRPDLGGYPSRLHDRLRRRRPGSCRGWPCCGRDLSPAGGAARASMRGFGVERRGPWWETCILMKAMTQFQRRNAR
jgi:hypothetical protein